jgi:hypothetical protein
MREIISACKLAFGGELLFISGQNNMGKIFLTVL